MIKCNGWDGIKNCGKPAKYFLSIHNAHGMSLWCEDCCALHWSSGWGCDKGNDACQANAIPIAIVERIQKECLEGR